MAEGGPGASVRSRAAPPGSSTFPSAFDLVDVGAALVTAGLLVVAGLGLTGPPRLLLALVFMSFVPGWVFLDHVRLAEGTAKFALAATLSLSLAAAVALASLWLHLWHPRALLDLSGALCLFGIAWNLVRGGPRTALL